VRIADQNAASGVDCDVVEIEQIAARIAAAAIPDAAALDGIGGSSVDGRPGAAGIISKRNVEMPDAEEFGGLRIARVLRGEKGEGAAFIVASHDFGEFSVLHAEGRAR